MVGIDTLAMFLRYLSHKAFYANEWHWFWKRLLIGLPGEREEQICFSSGWMTMHNGWISSPCFTLYFVVGFRKKANGTKINHKLYCSEISKVGLPTFHCTILVLISLFRTELRAGEVQDSGPNNTCPQQQWTPHSSLLWRGWDLFPAGGHHLYRREMILYSNVGWLLCTPAPPKIYKKACCGFFFQLRELISTKITFIIHFRTAPLICLIHCIKKVEKLTVENFHFPHLILFGLKFKEPALENSYYLKKEVGRWFVLTLTGRY